jgi:hypothetical protein
MGWGVLDDRHMAAPPGTATLGAEENAGMFTSQVSIRMTYRRILQIFQSMPSPSSAMAISFSSHNHLILPTTRSIGLKCAKKQS